nr:immunoglobulin light chain junction region [Macaca mulatta]
WQQSSYWPHLTF